MQTLIFTSVVSFLCLAIISLNKLWQIKRGTAEGSHDIHLVGPVAKAAHVHALFVAGRMKKLIEPTVRQAHKDILLLGYSASASLAKRFAKLANEIKGRGELPDKRNGRSFILAYAQKETGYDR